MTDPNSRQPISAKVARSAAELVLPPGRARAEGEGEMRALNLGTVVFSLVAAMFWFLSAGDIPVLRSYWGQAPVADPLYASLVDSSRLNQFAALFSGLAALCAGLSAIGPQTRFRRVMTACFYLIMIGVGLYMSWKFYEFGGRKLRLLGAAGGSLFLFGCYLFWLDFFSSEKL
jgi:hypothetical protein